MTNREDHRVALADYPQLRLIAWNRRDDDRIDETEALALYEANWRYVEAGKMDGKERAFLIRLAERYRNGVLNVKNSPTTDLRTRLPIGDVFTRRLG